MEKSNKKTRMEIYNDNFQSYGKLIFEDGFFVHPFNGCGFSTLGGMRLALRLNDLEDWNTRPAPTIGRCGECAKLKKGGLVYGWCKGEAKPFDGFCSEFEPKE